MNERKEEERNAASRELGVIRQRHGLRVDLMLLGEPPGHEGIGHDEEVEGEEFTNDHQQQRG